MLSFSYERLDHEALDCPAWLKELERVGKINDVVLDDCTIRWRCFGSGEPLVLLHGGCGSWMHWARNILPLAKGRRVLVPDMPGFGDSSNLPPPGDASPMGALDASVDRLAHSLRMLLPPGERICLAAFSFGSLVAARWGGRGSEVDRMLLLGPTGHGQARGSYASLLPWKSAASGDAASAALRQNLEASMLTGALGNDESASWIYERSCRQTRFRSKVLSRAGLLPVLLDGLQMPIKFIWGANDITAATPLRIGQSLCGGRRSRSLAIVPGAGHWVQYEQAAAVNDLIRHFIEASEPTEVAA